MARELTLRFRVDAEEKAQLQQRAAENDLSLSELIRSSLGLPRMASRGARVDDLTDRLLKAAIGKPPPPTDQVEALARQLFNSEGMTMPVARREAAKRLRA